MNLRRYLARKVIYVIITVFLIASINFFIIQVLPGDPTRVLLPRGCSGSNVTGGACPLRAMLIQQWGLNQPVTTRYLIYMWNLLHGNLGTTITYGGGGRPVADVIGSTIWTTLILVGVATTVTMWLGIVLGRISGWHRGRSADIVITMSTLFGYSMPSFWVSLILFYLLAVAVPLFPAYWNTGAYATMDLPSIIVDYVWHMILPIAAFVITNVAWFSLTLRNSLTDVLPEDYIVTAAAKGLDERHQLRDHAMPNARLPLVTASALYFGWVVSGAIVIEFAFGIQGLGSLTWTATGTNDYPLMAGIFLVATLGVVIANAVADVLYAFLDPRVREA
ncbi:MAG TPA: ABC transporter permease [Thermoplasmata archaeon]|nr:ABC transporter permease [Thermoplasmata archaeon]